MKYLESWDIKGKDIIYIVAAILMFAMNFGALKTRLENIEKATSEIPPLRSRMDKLEQAFVDVHDIVMRMDGDKR